MNDSMSGALRVSRKHWHKVALALAAVMSLVAAAVWHVHGAAPSQRNDLPTNSAPHAAADVPTAPDVGPQPDSTEGLAIPEFPQTIQIGQIEPVQGAYRIRLCQATSPAAPYPIHGVDGTDCGGCGEAYWWHSRPLPFQTHAQGEYVDPGRIPHICKYRLRVDDQLNLVYRLTRRETSKPYELNVGDSIRIESLTDPNLDRQQLIIQPDGMITLRLLGQVRAARRTVEELRLELEERYTKYYKVPAITVTPLEVNTKLKDLRDTVDSRAGFGGQSIEARVAPDGTVQLPKLGSVPAQGLTLEELKAEIDARYHQDIQGIEVTPILRQRAPRYAYVLGEVDTPGRYELTGPTTVSQAIAMAGGWHNGANLRQIVVFRRGEDWRLLATRLDLNGSLLGKRPAPSDEIWVRDSDIVLVPKSAILVTAEFIDLVFQQCIYGVLPFQGVSISISSLSSL